MKNIFQFIRAKLTEYKKISSVKTDQELKQYWIFSWSVYSFLYPVVRIFMAKKDAIAFCEKVIRPPAPQVREDIHLKDKADFDIFIEVFLRDVYKRELLKEGMVVIDVGAHIGIYSVLAAKKVEKVVALEPFSKNYERLKENSAPFKNIITKNIALSNRKGEMPFYVSEFSFSHSLNADIAKESGTYTEASATVSTLDELVRELGLEKVDLIKIDTEGEELNILKGAEETLKKNPKALIVAASYHYPTEKQEIEEFLKERGFEILSDEIEIVIAGGK